MTNVPQNDSNTGRDGLMQIGICALPRLGGRGVSEAVRLEHLDDSLDRIRKIAQRTGNFRIGADWLEESGF